jgi:hypothetical protein
MSIDLIDSCLKASQLGNMKFNNFDDVMPKLLNYFSENNEIDWSKPGCKTTYNNIKIFEILGFRVSIKKIEKKTKAEIKLKYKNTIQKVSVKIFIRLQDFFQYKVVEFLKNESISNDKLNLYFMRHDLMDSKEIEISNNEIRYNVKDSDILIDDNKLSIEVIQNCAFNSYRVDMLLHITGKYYLCLEFFENRHKNPNQVDLSNELNRITSLVYNNKSINKKIVHVGIFWESNINDEIKFNTFMKKVVIDNIEKYWNIDNIEDYIINGISKELGVDKQVSKILYDANENPNKPIILLDKIMNPFFNWKKNKEQECKKKVFNKFTKKISQFQKIDDIILDDDDCIILEDDCIILEDDGILENANLEQYKPKETKIYYDSKTDKLTNYGLTLYISYLITSDVLNCPDEEEYWIDFNTKITRGFINGLKKIRSDTLLLCDKFMTGLYDCY